MKLRCKPGDLALILHDTPECAGNIGRMWVMLSPHQANHHGVGAAPAG